jgi:hypothetical protein
MRQGASQGASAAYQRLYLSDSNSCASFRVSDAAFQVMCAAQCLIEGFCSEEEAHEVHPKFTKMY